MSRLCWLVSSILPTSISSQVRFLPFVWVKILHSIRVNRLAGKFIRPDQQPHWIDPPSWGNQLNGERRNAFNIPYCHCLAIRLPEMRPPSKEECVKQSRHESIYYNIIIWNTGGSHDAVSPHRALNDKWIGRNLGRRRWRRVWSDHAALHPDSPHNPDEGRELIREKLKNSFTVQYHLSRVNPPSIYPCTGSYCTWKR